MCVWSSTNLSLSLSYLARSSAKSCCSAGSAPLEAAGAAGCARMPFLTSAISRCGARSLAGARHSFQLRPAQNR